MSYEPTNWKAGDTVTSAKLNKIEQGVASAGSGSVLVVHEVEGTLDATYKQIVDAIHSNGAILEEVGLSGYNVVANFVEYGHDAESGLYVLTTFVNTGGSVLHHYATDSENSYPVNDD